MSQSSSHLTLRGGLLLIASVALLLVGLVLREASLMALGLTCLLLTPLSYFLSWLNLRGVTLEATLPHRVHAKRAFEGILTLQNTHSIWDTYHIHTSFTLPSDTRIEHLCQWLPARQVNEHHLQATIPQRNASLELPYELSSSFPFGLVQRKRASSLSHPLIVYPLSITPKELLSQGEKHDGTPAPSLIPSDSLSEPRGIRPWQPGDPAKSIHWPASARSMARGHDLRVRENDPPGYHPRHCAVLFHSFGTRGDLVREDRFERALSLTAGTLQHLLGHGVKTTLHADFLGWHPQHASTRAQVTECLALLAEAQHAQTTEAHDIQRTIHSIPQQTEIIVISDMSLETWLPHLNLPSRTLPIDIRQINFERRRVRSALSVVSSQRPSAASPL